MLTTSLPPEVKLRIEAFIGGRHVWGPISAVSLMASSLLWEEFSCFCASPSKAEKREGPLRVSILKSLHLRQEQSRSQNVPSAS